jgi:hypothetical protein
MRTLLIALLLLLLPGAASAQAGKFDGVWNGKAGAWTIKLTIAGTKGRLALTCTATTYTFNVPVAADGTIESWLSSEQFARRQIAGRLPSVVLSSGSAGTACPGGVTNLSLGR